MAQKAAKSLAARNTTRLNTTHSITAFLHLFHLLLRLVLFRSSFTRSSLLYYVLCASPALLLEFWLESVGRPKYAVGGEGVRELKRSGEDLDAKGLTEWMWDVVYWTWGCVALASVMGDWGWSFWLVVPVYTIYCAYTTYTGARSGMGLGGDAGEQAQGSTTGSSKRQQKLEKRGGQKVAYR